MVVIVRTVVIPGKKIRESNDASMSLLLSLQLERLLYSFTHSCMPQNIYWALIIYQLCDSPGDRHKSIICTKH